jgi:thiol-disulfide isomerase/thioredoxin
MSPARREALILGGVAAAAAAIGGLAGVLALQSRSGAAQLLGSRFHDVAGQPRRLQEWEGKALACNFWATWCAPCREEIPLLAAAQQQYASLGLQVVGIAVDNAANVRQFEQTVRIGYPVLLADPSAIDLMRKLGNSSGGLPFTVLLDRQGRVAGRRLGPYSGADLEAAVAALLQ